MNTQQQKLANLRRDLARCEREIAECLDYLAAGRPDVRMACHGLHDWSVEKSLIEAEIEKLNCA